MKIKFTLFCYFILLPWQLHAQLSKLPINQQRLLLELSSGYYNVASVGQINLDSSLIAASSYLKMSRIPVILEGFENDFKGRDISWIDSRNIMRPKKQLNKLTGIEHLKSLLLIGAYYSFQSGDKTSDADSALAYLFKAKKESEILNSTFWLNNIDILISKTYLKENNFQMGKAFTNLAIRNCNSPSTLAIKAKANYYYTTYCPFILNLTSERISSLVAACVIYRQLKDTTGEIISNTYQSNLTAASGNFKKARELSLLAINQENLLKFPFIQYNEDQVAMYDCFMLDYVEALSFAEKAIDQVEYNKEDFGLSIFYERLGLAYAGNDFSNPETYYWFKKSVDETIRNPHFYIVYFPLFSLVDKLIQEGKATDALNLAKKFLTKFPPHIVSEKMQAQDILGECYEAQKNYPNAEKNYFGAVQLVKLLNDPANPYAKEAYENLGIFYVDTKKYEQARPLLIACLNNPTVTDEVKGIIEKNLSIIDSASGNYQAAFVHLENFTKLTIKIFDKRGIDERARLETKLETKEREASIKLLEAKTKADQAELQKVGLQRNLTFGGILALFLVSGLVYNGYRNKNRSNRLLNAQQKEINDKNHSLEELLSEKDILLEDKDLLLKEVNHRVKNNLHIVMSLLESQSSYLEDNAVISAIQDTQNRVHSIALIHQKLYNSENITQVDMQSYIPELINYLNDSINIGKNIAIITKIESIFLDVSQAIPVGIILNETITNAIKYAFNKDDQGEIIINMSQTDDLIELMIADNGVGLPPDFATKNAKSLGMNLIKGLTNQLNGKFTIEGSTGTTIKIDFQIDLLHLIK